MTGKQFAFIAGVVLGAFVLLQLQLVRDIFAILAEDLEEALP